MSESRALIVTGASRGVGAATARWLGQIGTSVTLVARTGAALNEVARDVEQLGGKVLVVAGDVADPSVCSDAVAKTLDHFGRLDAVVNNAAVLEPLANTLDADPAAWRYNLEVNVMGPFYLAQAALPALQKRRGRIVNVSSGASKIAIEGAGAYCAAKTALTHYTRVLAVESPLVTAVSVRPGHVDTDMQTMLREEGARFMPKEQGAYYQSLKRDNRLELPEVPGRAIAWLALHAPRAWSGRYLDYDDQAIASQAAGVFGNSLNLDNE